MAEAQKLIGICLSTPHMEDRFLFLRALNAQAVARGYRLLVFSSCSDLYERVNSNNDGERAVFRLIPYERLAAMIVFPHFLFNDPIVDEIIQNSLAHGLPTIVIDTTDSVHET